MRPLLLVVVLALAGCATVNHRPSTIAVPFIPQKTDYCGPAALAMLANYYGHPVTQDEIAQAIYLPAIHGTLTTELADYARRFHLFVRQYRGSPDDLRQKLAAGIPLIALGHLGDHWHYFVVLYDGDPLIVHTDIRAFQPMRREDFLRWWDRADHWTLLVCPPDRMTWTLSTDEHNDLGYHFEQAGQLPAAAQHYRAALDLRSDNPYFALNLGNALRKQGQLREAAAAFGRAPGNADALNNHADVLCELGEHLDQAAAMCHRAVELMPTHRAYYLDTLGSVLLKQGKKTEAVAAFEQALAATTARETSLRTGIQQRLATARSLAEK